MNILAAEDSAVARKILTSSLLRWGYQVTEAVDGTAAWDLFQRGDYPIVVTDWVMPDMDGLELLRRIRAVPRDPQVYVILLTSKSEKEDLVQAMEAGADDFLGKPFAPDELRVRIRQGERVVALQRTLAEQNQTLRNTQAALVHSEKLASLAQLAAGMAHEINNPIAYVTNNLSVIHRDSRDLLDLLDRYGELRRNLGPEREALAEQLARLEQDAGLGDIRDELPRLLESSRDGLKRVRDIVLNLRQFARLDEAEVAELDLNGAILSTVAILRRSIEEKRLRVERQSAVLPLVTCQPGKVNQVLHSLLLNAIQASEPEGILKISTRTEEEGVIVEIGDQGCGIAPEHQSRIFEPFFTTRPVGQGRGLGLSISYGIVSDHGGRIEVESEVGRGSVFRVWLPLKPPFPLAN